MMRSSVVICALVCVLSLSIVPLSHAKSSHLRSEQPHASTNRASILIQDATQCQYAVMIDGDQNFLQGNGASFFLGGEWFSSEVSSDPSISRLELMSFNRGTGEDEIGPYTSITCTWSPENAPTTAIETIFYTYLYLNAIVFEQRYVSGNGATSTGDRNSVNAAFPTFQRNDELAFLSYNGDFLKYTKASRWLNRTGNVDVPIASGLSAGPTIFFNASDASLATVAVLSPYNEFMTASQWMIDDELRMGPIGSMESIPSSFSLKYLLYVGEQGGIYNSIQEWGGLLVKSYGKPNRMAEDTTINYLGYNTDNGAYYYYQTEPGKNYEQTLLDVHAYAQANQLPYRIILLDSWWYFKGLMGGVSNWTARPEIFPHGLDAFKQATGWDIIAHNRYWSGDVDYAKQNGGDYDFIIDGSTRIAMPQDLNFWRFLFNSSSSWLNVYEQDWLYNELEGVGAATTQVGVAQSWMDQMAAAASENNINIQYCMPWPRHILSSVAYPAVTQIRASDDYQPGVTDQWKVGYSSMLYQSINVAPFKDGFWTVQQENGNWYNYTEPAPALESAIATLTTGPVTIDDMIGLTDRSMVMKTCRADGLLLKPDIPLHYSDQQVFYEATQIAGSGPSGINMITHSTVNTAGQAEPVFHQLLVANLSATYSFTINQLPSVSNQVRVEQLEQQRKQRRAHHHRHHRDHQHSGALDVDSPSSELQYVAWQWTNASSYGDPLPQSAFLFDATHPLQLVPCGVSDFSLYHFSPLLNNSWSVIGEWSKWVPMSSNRFSQLSWNQTAIQVKISGSANEVVNVAFAQHLLSAEAEDESFNVDSFPQLLSRPAVSANDSPSLGGSILVFSASCTINASGSVELVAYLQSPTITFNFQCI